MSKFAVVLLAGLEATQITRPAFTTRLICVAPRYPAGVDYVICFGVRMELRAAARSAGRFTW